MTRFSRATVLAFFLWSIHPTRRTLSQKSPLSCSAQPTRTEQDTIGSNSALLTKADRESFNESQLVFSIQEPNKKRTLYELKHTSSGAIKKTDSWHRNISRHSMHR